MARLRIWGSMTYSIIQLSVKSKKKRKRSRSSSSSATSESATSSGSDSSGNFSSYYYYLVIANWIFGESVRNADCRLGTKYRLKNNTIDHISCWNVPIVMHLFLPVHRRVFFLVMHWTHSLCVILLLNNQMGLSSNSLNVVYW